MLGESADVHLVNERARRRMPQGFVTLPIIAPRVNYDALQGISCIVSWFCGGSAIIDPRGVVIAAASADREELVQADLSEEIVRSVRQRVKSLAHRREDLYG